MDVPKVKEETTSDDKVHDTNVNKANDPHPSKGTEGHHPSFLTPLKDKSILTIKNTSKPPHGTLTCFTGSVDNSDNSFEKDHFLEGEAALQTKQFAVARKHFRVSLEVTCGVHLHCALPSLPFYCDVSCTSIYISI
mmetsp:Transcript_31651/g.36556  ORF Transcript_31651/g.36556 Transcript_31651/m.36556 type:complete len:136 (-) Transcript_31651:1683-2090(-)